MNAGEVESPLILNVILHLRMGGMENGLINLINGTPANRYRHAVLCLQDYSEFRQRIRDPQVPILAIGKRPGKDPKHYASVWRILRKLRPAVVHTRNLPGLDCTAIAALAGVPVRVHGEHGWDVADLHGTNRRYRCYRRLTRPFVTRYVAVSQDIANWLAESIHVRPRDIAQIYNGVDTLAFRPRRPDEPRSWRTGVVEGNGIVVGTVGRLQAVKDQITLVRAVAQLHTRRGRGRRPLRLVILGDGPERVALQAEIARSGIEDICWMPGARDDVAVLMRSLDMFALPSLNEGISNTILEAMASGVPVIASRVGGNPELVEDGRSGALFTAGDTAALTASLERYCNDPELVRAHGARGRALAEEKFSLTSMVSQYLELYDTLLKRSGRTLQPKVR